jgi:hypothetical protein
MKLTALDFSVPILAAVSCLLMFLDIPVWALFIGWAWYFALGATPDLITKGILPLITGSSLAVLAFVLIDVFAGIMPEMPAIMLAVFISVFLLMLTLKVPMLNKSLVSFNGYSCIFVGFVAGTFMEIGAMPALLNAAIWITGANFIGLLFGWMSVTVTQIGKKNENG